MEWLTDPTIWVGLLTLVVLEIILGIDNLIFVAILADKLPPHQRDRARVIGLSLALLMRLGLLASISWVMSLTAPLFTVFTLEISWRDLILVLGGVFLLIKATIEIHDRLEAGPPEHADSAAYARFWPVVAQIVVLDAVFSLDSVITAIGMVDEIYVMMAAVVIAMIVMIVASKPLTTFVNAHPALVILCLGFLLMVGFVLVADGLGYHVPKGYLYAAIGFSVLIETFNQLALHNRRKWAALIPLAAHGRRGVATSGRCSCTILGRGRRRRERSDPGGRDGTGFRARREGNGARSSRARRPAGANDYVAPAGSRLDRSGRSQGNRVGRSSQ